MGHRGRQTIFSFRNDRGERLDYRGIGEDNRLWVDSKEKNAIGTIKAADGLKIENGMISVSGRLIATTTTT
jgi:hypothetical protein